jgi:hypothetical protein
MSIPNEALPNVSHNRQLPHLSDRIRTNPTGIRADSDAGGEVARGEYSPKGSGAKRRGLND